MSERIGSTRLEGDIGLEPQMHHNSTTKKEFKTNEGHPVPIEQVDGIVKVHALKMGSQLAKLPGIWSPEIAQQPRAVL